MTTDIFTVIVRMSTDPAYANTIIKKYKENPELLSDAERIAIKSKIKEQKEKMSIILFSKYLKAKGLSNENNTQILALGKSNIELLQLMLQSGLNTYALIEDSRSTPPMMNTQNIGKGTFTASGILLPDNNNLSLLAEEMLASRFGSEMSSNDLPSIQDFDTIVVEGIYPNIPTVLMYDKQNYVGFCELVDETITSEKLEFYTRIVEKINSKFNQQYVLTNDYDTQNGTAIAYHLIRRDTRKIY